MELWQKIILRLLYLTPFGYILSALMLLRGEKIKGLNINLGKYSPIRVTINQKPTITDRFGWFINSIFLLSEGWFVLERQIAGDWGGTFALIAFIFGGVCLVSAIFPNLPWNRKFF